MTYCNYSYDLSRRHISVRYTILVHRNDILVGMIGIPNDVYYLYTTSGTHIHAAVYPYGPSFCGLILGRRLMPTRTQSRIARWPLSAVVA